MFAALSTVEPPILELQTAVVLEPDKPWAAERLPLVKDRVRGRLDQLSRRLGNAHWLEGAFSAGDLLMVSVLLRTRRSGLLEEYPNLAAYVARGEARPAYQRAFDAAVGCQHPQGETMNPVVHFELPYDNAERAAAFYRAAFGWQTQQFGGDMGNYVVVTTATADARPDAPRGTINGGLYQKKADFPAQYPSIVIGVEDLERSMRAVRTPAVKLLGEPVEIPGVGRYVSSFDTERNRNGLLQPKRGGTP